VIINGGATLAVRVPVTGEVSFHVQDDPRTALPVWAPGKPDAGGPRDLLKDADTEGPMDDVFRARFILVSGTMGDAEADAVCRAEAEWFAREVWEPVQHVRPIIRTDDEIGLTDFREANLVLIGGPTLNRITERLQRALPVTFHDDGGIDVDGVRLTPPHGALAMVYPNPAYPARYVLILAGTGVESTRGLFRRVDRDFDYQAFDENTKHPETPALSGFFDRRWKFDRRRQWPERVGGRGPVEQDEPGDSN
jgi:hypothetical protein